MKPKNGLMIDGKLIPLPPKLSRQVAIVVQKSKNKKSKSKRKAKKQRSRRH
jgi:hypothetical protein